MSQSGEVSYERRLVLGLPFLLAGSMQARAEDSFTALTRACDALAADLLEKKSLNADEYLSAAMLFSPAYRASPRGVGNTNIYDFAFHLERDVSDSMQILQIENVEVLPDGRFTITGPRGGRVHLIGIEDRGGAVVRGAGEEQRLATLLAELPETESVILLAHRPELFGGAAGAGVALTLSGHTHGGQIALRLGGKRILGPGNMMSRFVHGLFERGGAYLYVNRGLGLVGQPVRVGAPREIVLLKLMAVDRCTVRAAA